MSLLSRIIVLMICKRMDVRRNEYCVIHFHDVLYMYVRMYVCASVYVCMLLYIICMLLYVRKKVGPKNVIWVFIFCVEPP